MVDSGDAQPVGGGAAEHGHPVSAPGEPGVEGGAAAVFRRELEDADDPEARRRELEQSLNAARSPFRTAEQFQIEEIIDPRETRPLLCEWVALMQPRLRAELGPKARGIRP